MQRWAESGSKCTKSSKLKRGRESSASYESHERFAHAAREDGRPFRSISKNLSLIEPTRGRPRGSGSSARTRRNTVELMGAATTASSVFPVRKPYGAGANSAAAMSSNQHMSDESQDAHEGSLGDTGKQSSDVAKRAARHMSSHSKSTRTTRLTLLQVRDTGRVIKSPIFLLPDTCDTAREFGGWRASASA